MGLIENNLLLIARAVFGISVIVFLWAIFWDRARGRSRCRKCRYRMEGTPEADDGTITCPECGRKHKNTRTLRYTRRRWRIALLALTFVLLGGYMANYHWRFRERGWVGYVPTTALILWPPNLEKWHAEASNMARLPVGRPTRTGLYDELNYRTFRIGMWGWQEQLYVSSIRRTEKVSEHSGKRWRFLPIEEFNAYSWQSHTCNPWCNFGGYGRWCPGEGATVLVAEQPADRILGILRTLAEILTDQEVTGRGGSSGLDPMREKHVSVIGSLSNWARHARFALYYTDAAGEETMQVAIGALRRKPGWIADEGRTPIQDIPVTIFDRSMLLRRFDLNATYEKAVDRSLDMPLAYQEEKILSALSNGPLGEIDEGAGIENLGSLFSLVYRHDLFVADTESTLDLVGERLQEFHDSVYPGFWQDQPGD
jgi:hypothetical protein